MPCKPDNTQNQKEKETKDEPDCTLRDGQKGFEEAK